MLCVQNNCRTSCRLVKLLRTPAASAGTTAPASVVVPGPAALIKLNTIQLGGLYYLYIVCSHTHTHSHTYTRSQTHTCSRDGIQFTNEETILALHNLRVLINGTPRGIHYGSFSGSTTHANARTPPTRTQPSAPERKKTNRF